MDTWELELLHAIQAVRLPALDAVMAGMLLGMAVGVIARRVSMALCKAMERKRAQG